ncbi:septum site-determining protein MinC [Photobacterium sp. GJ3]|uniref:septum site-determining protein MinC n=1 Tax=Photobacterium sp. GJ3 TaxID=2829502 RepID=UPI001B8B32A7|nr:septum site-determining protein MinC [Photobacterium sp. GJ3]QUJ68397.1 septum site-determining protein MinC [Photobacterium sp. GJ3]
MTKTAELKGSSYTLSSLHLADGGLDQAITFLKDKVEQAPAFFAHAPLVIDVSQSSHEQLDFEQLRQGIQDAGMIPVGISGCKPSHLQAQAKSAGFAIMNAAKQAKATSPVMQPTKVVRAPVRSGQQIYAKNCDLVVLNHVSAGAEIIADGCIHIYGCLRGRAIAGASGENHAQIFCHNLQSELISIAGNYWLSDKIHDTFWGKSVVISLTDNNLNIEHLAV